MQLDDKQKQAVTAWVKEGCGLSEIQKRLRDELGISITYLDVRFLVIEMGLKLKEQAPKSPVKTDLQGGPVGRNQKAGPAAAADVAGEGYPAAGPGGDVRVTVDRVMKAGSLASGTVVFSDGVSASWMLDQMGRLAVQAGKPDYRPSEQDLAAFQDELRAALETQGF